MKKILLSILLISIPCLAMANTKIPAKDITAASSSWTGNLPTSADTVQKALDAIDALVITATVNWDDPAALEALATVAINWDDMPIIQPTKINWTDVIESTLTGINWDKYLDGGAVNWEEMPIIQKAGINWVDVTEFDLIGINWEKYLNGASINWYEVPAYEVDPQWVIDKSSYSTKTQADLLYLGITATAADSSKLNGQSASYYQTALGYTPANSAITVNGQALTGNVTITTITGNAGTASALATNPTACADNNYVYDIDADGTLHCRTDQTGGGGSISGLTAGYIPVASSSTTIVDSMIYSNGVNVGIGSSSPTSELDVAGNVKANYFYGDGSTLSNLPSGMVYAGAGLVISTGSAWASSVSIGTTGQYLRGDFTLANFPSIPTALADLSDDATHRLVTDTEKSTWNGKQDALGFTPANSTITVNGQSLTGNVSITTTQWDGGNVGINTTTARQTLALVPGTDVQAYNANLTAINQALTTTSSPTFVTVSANLTGNVTGDVSGNAGTVTNGVYTTGAGTVFLAPNGSAASLTSFPTLNQNTTGTAAGLTTARTIAGNSFDGTANIKGGAISSTNYDATTSAQFAGVISDEVGTGSLVFNASPNFTGNVGIGTTVTTAPLTVKGDASLNGSVTMTTATVTNNIVVTSGNVGIGSASPIAKLDVAGSGFISPIAVTSDPCATQPEGTLFYNSTNHEWCYCDNSGVDLRIKDSSTACF